MHLVSWPTLLATLLVLGLLLLSIYVGQKIWFRAQFRFKWRCPDCLFHYESNTADGLEKVKWSHNLHFHSKPPIVLK